MFLFIKMVNLKSGQTFGKIENFFFFPENIYF